MNQTNGTFANAQQDYDNLGETLVFTVPEVAAFLGQSKQWVLNRIRCGCLRAKQFSNRLLVKEVDLEFFIHLHPKMPMRLRGKDDYYRAAWARFITFAVIFDYWEICKHRWRSQLPELTEIEIFHFYLECIAKKDLLRHLHATNRKEIDRFARTN